MGLEARRGGDFLSFGGAETSARRFLFIAKEDRVFALAFQGAFVAAARGCAIDLASAVAYDRFIDITTLFEGAETA